VDTTADKARGLPRASRTLPGVLLRLEGAAVLAAAVIVYYDRGWSWLAFALLLLVPDVGLLALLAGPRTGAYVYDALHVYVGPVALLVASLLGDWPPGMQVAVIWLAHIGMDRLVGYGLRYPTGARETHLQRV